MAAATERSIDVGSVRSQRERSNRFVAQNGNMRFIGVHPSATRASETQAFETGRKPAWERDRLRDLRLPLHFVPQLELLTLPDEHDAFVEAGVAPQRGRNENPARRVDLDVIGMTDEQALQAADAVIER